MSGSTHLRGIVIAGVLAVLALVLGLATLAMNNTASQASSHVIVPLTKRHAATSGRSVRKAQSATAKKTKKAAVKRPDPNVVAALAAGLPPAIAHALGQRRVVVVELQSNRDPVSKLSSAEAHAGAALAGAAFVGVDVDRDGGDASKLTAALGKFMDAPATLVYARPASLVQTLPGFSDRSVVQQAAADASTGHFSAQHGAS